MTTPPHPASKARMMLLSDSVGGADDSRKGLTNRSPANVTESSTLMGTLYRVSGSQGRRVAGSQGRRVAGSQGRVAGRRVAGPLRPFRPVIIAPCNLKSSLTSSADDGSPSSATEFLDVHNPARGTVIARTPLSTARDVDAAVAAASKAFAGWSETPPVVRARTMFTFKALLEDHFDELARLVTTEHGKTLDESRGSVRRGIECVEVACGAPSLLMGYGLENVAAGIDCSVMRQPIGVCAAIAPFNFPAMVPLWFLPFAVVSGNTFVLKPSEQVPLSQKRMFELLERCDLPPGVVNLVNGGREVVEAICDHPGIKAVSFVGSTPVARAVYQRATHAGKRVQALGGAKNFIVVMPDADLDRAIPDDRRIVLRLRRRAMPGRQRAAAGRRCARQARDRLIDAAAAMRVGDGLEPGVTMGPVISAKHRERVLSLRRAGRVGRRTAGARRPRDARTGSAGRLLRRPVGFRSGLADDDDRTRGDLRAGRVGVPGEESRRGVPA